MPRSRSTCGAGARLGHVGSRGQGRWLAALHAPDGWGETARASACCSPVPCEIQAPLSAPHCGPGSPAAPCLQSVQILRARARCDGARCLHQPVRERRLAVVNVCLMGGRGAGRGALRGGAMQQLPQGCDAALCRRAASVCRRAVWPALLCRPATRRRVARTASSTGGEPRHSAARMTSVSARPCMQVHQTCEHANVTCISACMHACMANARPSRRARQC